MDIMAESGDGELGGGPEHAPGARGGIDPLVSWLMGSESRALALEDVVAGAAERLRRDEDIELSRLVAGTLVTHPELRALSIHWRLETGAERFLPAHGIEDTEAYRGSPIEALHSGETRIRARLVGPNRDARFRLLEERAAQGVTDYLALAPRSSRGTALVVIFETVRAGGFTDGQLRRLEAIADPLSLRVELAVAHADARGLLDVYLGREAARRVWAGTVRRGQGERLPAALLYCDLRGFTSFADQCAPEDVVAVLDRYFEAICGPVEEAGGDVLKFIGDAVLAVFPASAGEAGERAACGAALTAARGALARVAAGEGSSPEPGELATGFALHLGEPLYGNVGARRRLDFTVIGPAVNEVCRLEPLTKELGLPLLISERFAARCGADVELSALGQRRLRGVSEPVALYTLADFASGRRDT